MTNSADQHEANIDRKTVDGFGAEWAAFDQTALSEAEHSALFEAYFSIFPIEKLPSNAEGFDLGCGSGRWAAGMVDKVGTLHCIDPSPEALAVARRRLDGYPAARFHVASADLIPLPDGSQDFGYSLGVLHHIPDTAKALRDCVSKLKVGAPFLLYIYYALDGKPTWFKALWRASDSIRKLISRAPFGIRKLLTNFIAGIVYWPLARTALLAERAGYDTSNFPLNYYRKHSFYTMRTDALDRFGTRLEQRFTREQISTMMTEAGLSEIAFREDTPFWVACGIKVA
ncbi:class I SAM-dependent methyltransferase [Sphingomonas sp. RB1R13]|uniref:class I SAM-dependent methyltransferase n=1 Tax=Sphingomonas sp. RB1R13 TaxID=3096159 RepID=UPI002FC88026